LRNILKNDQIWQISNFDNLQFFQISSSSPRRRPIETSTDSEWCTGISFVVRLGYRHLSLALFTIYILAEKYVKKLPFLPDLFWAQRCFSDKSQVSGSAYYDIIILVFFMKYKLNFLSIRAIWKSFNFRYQIISYCEVYEMLSCKNWHFIKITRFFC